MYFILFDKVVFVVVKKKQSVILNYYQGCLGTVETFVSWLPGSSKLLSVRQTFNWQATAFSFILDTNFKFEIKFEYCSGSRKSFFTFGLTIASLSWAGMYADWRAILMKLVWIGRRVLSHPFSIYDETRSISHDCLLEISKSWSTTFSVTLRNSLGWARVILSSFEWD